MKFKKFIVLALAVLGLLCVNPCLAGKVHRDFPAAIDPDGIYVFYSHGAIVEGGDPKPKHSKWGVYDFPAIKRSLADSGFEVIAPHRAQNTDPSQHAKILAEQVGKLLGAGVEPNRISLLGFSKGGYISARAAGEIGDAINVILLAACRKWVNRFPDIRLQGNLFSIYETSDSVGSCKKFAGNSPDLVSFEEISISTGLSHGAFYRPIEEWMKPVRDWIQAKAN
jgi:hypothetical protein